MSNTTIAQRLVAIFGLIIALFLVVSAAVFWKTHQVQDSARIIVDITLPKARALNHLFDAYFQMRIKTRNIILFDDAEAIDKEYVAYVKYKKDFTDAIKAMEDVYAKQSDLSDEEKNSWPISPAAMKPPCPKKTRSSPSAPSTRMPKL